MGPSSGVAANACFDANAATHLGALLGSSWGPPGIVLGPTGSRIGGLGECRPPSFLSQDQKADSAKAPAECSQRKHPAIRRWLFPSVRLLWTVWGRLGVLESGAQAAPPTLQNRAQEASSFSQDGALAFGTASGGAKACQKGPIWNPRRPIYLQSNRLIRRSPIGCMIIYLVCGTSWWLQSPPPGS